MRVIGSALRPRLSVFRSAKHIEAQIIDDGAGRTIVAVHDREVKSNATGKQDRATAVGKLVGERARAQGITKVVFDRAGYAYHGRVKAVADGARAAGLEF